MKKRKYRIPDGYMPTIDEVNSHIAFRSTPEYIVGREKENALVKLFEVLCPENKDLNDILIKCSALNDFYSTNILDIHSVAHHIWELKIDERLECGDYILVNEMAHVAVGKPGKPKISRFFYSFATKYCSHQLPKKYAIYDSYVEKILWDFQKRDRFSHFKVSDLKDYPTFMSVIQEFQKFYGLEQFNVKQLDQYLWQIGKKYFAKYR